MLRPFTKYLFTFIITVFVSIAAVAQDWSYIYLQGDKKTPFYVKLEGEMLPRYGKNYCIIPRLAAGPIHVQILFQQNIYPPQDFTILVPEDGYRGFLLTKKDNVYALYDLQQQFYLMPGAEDHLPDPEAAPVPARAPVVLNEVKEISPAQPVEEVAPPPVTAAVARQPKSSSEPVFIEHLVLKKENTNETAPADTPETRDTSEGTIPALESGRPGIPNSDCSGPMPATEFNNLLSNVPNQQPNDKLIVYFLKRATDGCFTTRQVYQMASRLETESVRFTFLKNVYSHVTDQHNFSMLEHHLFQTSEWKQYFRSIQ